MLLTDMFSKIGLGLDHSTAQTAFVVLFRTMNGLTMHTKASFVGIVRLAEWAAISAVGYDDWFYVRTCS